MNKRGSAVAVLLIIIFVVFVAGGILYYEAHKHLTTSPVAATQSVVSSSTETTTPEQTVPPAFSFSCPQSSTTAYEDPQAGIAFCYPSVLTVSTGSITWPSTYVYPLGTPQAPQHPQISFGITHDSDRSLVFPSLSSFGPPGLNSRGGTGIGGCESSGAYELWCAFPKSSQVTYGTNENGFKYVFFRYDMVTSGDTPVLTTSAGPIAFIPLIQQNYLYFSDGLFTILPTSTDSDLMEILNSVAIMPQQYTGVGLTLANSSSGVAVYNVIKNSPAAAAGIQDGNIILAVNTATTTDMDANDATSLLSAATGTIAIEVQQSKGQSPVSFDLTPQTFFVSGSDLGAMYENLSSLPIL
jgi:hypothetical protein